LTDLSLHILDIAENSINAGAKCIEINIIEDEIANKISIEIKDDGHGMEKEILDKITDPFVTTRTTRRVGLGIPLLKQAVELCNGGLKIESEKGIGTKLIIWMELFHIDRQPLGNVMETILTLAISEKIFNLIFSHNKNGNEFRIDLDEFKELTSQIGIGTNEFLIFLKKYLEKEYNNFKTK
jgi:anti-sigma regulatory factor (Ser/Thr protein kinase)